MYFLSVVLAIWMLHPQRIQAEDWLHIFSGPLRQNAQDAAGRRSDLELLGSPVAGNTVGEFGIQHHMLQGPPPVPPFVQVDLGAPSALDCIVLVPAVVDFRSSALSAYAFPPRFRLDASDAANFAEFTPLRIQTESDFVQEGVAPLVVQTPGLRARYLRLTVTKLAHVDGVWTFALSELMALQGNRNIAHSAQVKQGGGIHIPPRWAPLNLTDGRSPLGPPLRPGSSLPEFDALFAKTGENASPAWMAVDLGRICELQEIRLHPLHARQGADVPGFRFPLQFRVDIADDEKLSEPRVLWDSMGIDFSNPGNNPVTIRTPAARGRFIRVVMLKPEKPGADSFALSELEVYAEDRNVARGARVLSSGDSPRSRPLQDLTDGMASFGELMELPKWIAGWEARSLCQEQLEALNAQLPQLESEAKRRALAALGGAGLIVAAAATRLFVRSRRRQAQELAEFRAQLARDMHDEVGSNLAGIAVISELAARSGSAEVQDWEDVNRIARETTEAMREVLWVAGARQESGFTLVPQLQSVASRLLQRQSVTWQLDKDAVRHPWSPEEARQIFLFFKEALANVTRHSDAHRVQIALQLHGSLWELSIQDDGRGFEAQPASRGIGLVSLRERARSLGGSTEIDSKPGHGTCLRLRVPVKKKRPQAE